MRTNMQVLTPPEKHIPSALLDKYGIRNLLVKRINQALPSHPGRLNTCCPSPPLPPSSKDRHLHQAKVQAQVRFAIAVVLCCLSAAGVGRQVGRWLECRAKSLQPSHQQKHESLASLILTSSLNHALNRGAGCQVFENIFPFYPIRP